MISVRLKNQLGQDVVFRFPREQTPHDLKELVLQEHKDFVQQHLENHIEEVRAQVQSFQDPEDLFQVPPVEPSLESIDLDLDIFYAGAPLRDHYTPFVDQKVPADSFITVKFRYFWKTNKQSQQNNNAESVCIYVRGPDQKLALEFSLHQTVAALREKTLEEMKLEFEPSPVDACNMYFAGRFLSSDATLWSVGVRNNSHLTLKFEKLPQPLVYTHGSKAGQQFSVDSSTQVQLSAEAVDVISKTLHQNMFQYAIFRILEDQLVVDTLQPRTDSSSSTSPAPKSKSKSKSKSSSSKKAEANPQIHPALASFPVSSFAHHLTGGIEEKSQAIEGSFRRILQEMKEREIREQQEQEQRQREEQERVEREAREREEKEREEKEREEREKEEKEKEEKEKENEAESTPASADDLSAVEQMGATSAVVSHRQVPEETAVEASAEFPQDISQETTEKSSDEQGEEKTEEQSEEKKEVNIEEPPVAPTFEAPAVLAEQLSQARKLRQRSAAEQKHEAGCALILLSGKNVSIPVVATWFSDDASLQTRSDYVKAKAALYHQFPQLHRELNFDMNTVEDQRLFSNLARLLQ
eukprot:TRINITY_DN2591_c0_g1_i2.p1 TRINITY_DN2591_c0_g1~~TRINITY_DN2591_c0_g1_i2.p1  ORF type:complete len:582 (-),score=175.66 TRINITY_DN2591_c0_g1_i2:20-1765(-)